MLFDRNREAFEAEASSALTEFARRGVVVWGSGLRLALQERTAAGIP